MRQLELILGEDRLRDGLREYLKRHAFGNATWVDLVRLLDERTPQNLSAWSRAWVEERGRPRFETVVRLDAQGRVTSVTLRATDPLGRGLVWPQKLSVAVGIESGTRLLPVDVSRASTLVTGRPASIGRDSSCRTARGSDMACSCSTPAASTTCSRTSRMCPTR
jgi:aminopeptidase N